MCAGRRFAVAVLGTAISVAAVGTAQAEDVDGWWPYNGNQPSWHCGPTRQFDRDLYYQACVSLAPDGSSYQALVHLNTLADDPFGRSLTINVMDDVNGVDQSGSDRTCGVGGPTFPGQYICFAHTRTAPHGANVGA
jgi:hypothetical protein